MGDQHELEAVVSVENEQPISPDHQAPTSRQEYQYESLPQGSFIRILVLQPGRLDDTLKGKLEFCSVDSTQSYKPLSYVWGPPSTDNSNQIFIGDDKVSKSLQLTASLYGALRRLRLPDQERRCGRIRFASTKRT